MKSLIIAAILWPMLVFGQSAIPKAVNETLNLAPRCKKGDLQRYQLDIEIVRLDDSTEAVAHRHDVLAYSQYCVSNAPDLGLRYEITVDSFGVGQFDPMGTSPTSLQIVHQLDAYKIISQFRGNVATKDGCYDLGLNFPDSLFYVEVFEFSEDYVYARLMEQLRYSAGRQLSRIGDSAMVRFPAPICLGVKDVVRNYKLDLGPQVLRLTGLTKYAGRACATVEIGKSTSKIAAEFWAGDSNYVPVKGQLTIQGQLLIDIETGFIRYAKFVESNRSVAFTRDNKNPKTNATKEYVFRQIN